MLRARVPLTTGKRPRPLARVTEADLEPPPRMPTGDEQLARLLVRNVFVEDREDRIVPQVYDDLVGLVWYRGRFVPAVIEHERFTPLRELERLHRDVPWLLFRGTKDQLSKFLAPARSVRGRIYGAYPAGFNQSSNAAALWHILWKRRRKRNWHVT